MLKLLLEHVELLEYQMSLFLDDGVDIRLSLTGDGDFYTVSVLYNDKEYLTETAYSLDVVCSRILKVLRNEV